CSARRRARRRSRLTSSGPSEGVRSSGGRGCSTRSGGDRRVRLQGRPSPGVLGRGCAGAHRRPPCRDGDDRPRARAGATCPTVLAVDVGGSRVKVLCSSGGERRRFDSGPTLTPEKLVEGVSALTRDWTYDVLSIGVPAPVKQGRIMTEPVNLGHGWV